jgi:hypothetical protein
MAQTAMHALWEWIDANYHEDNFNINDARDMSLKLEKEQLINAYENGQYKSADYFNPENPHQETSENYYNKTYNIQ